VLVVIHSLLVLLALSGAPTPESAVAADQAIADAMLADNADQLAPLLAPDWLVVNTQGRTGSRDDMLDGMRSGHITRKTLTLSDPRVRMNGDVAWVTTHVATSGTLNQKDFDVQETQTDVLVWKDGVWTSVLLHETKYAV
jgi:ketosteroid isomerase-like protein